MAYAKTTWVDRIVQFSNRFTKTNESSGSVDLTPFTGTVAQAGTPLSAANMNKMEQGIYDAYNTAMPLQREVAILKAYSTVENRIDGPSNVIFDIMDGLNSGSTGRIDLSKANATSAIAASGTTKVVPITGVTTGLAVGQEVTIFDDVNLERRNITALVANTSVSFAAMTNSYKAGALICRSSVIQDTVSKLLKFNGWTHNTAYTNTAASVVGAAYTITGNGRKSVKTTNNWLIAMELNSTIIQVQYSPDNGTTWNALCSISGVAGASPAMAVYGNLVTIVWTISNGIYSNTFDVTTVTNTDKNSSKLLVVTETSINGNLNVTAKPTGIICVTASVISPTYPNSLNVIEVESTTSTVTAWGSPAFLTTTNVTGTDNQSPTIVIKSDGNPVVNFYTATATTWAISSLQWINVGSSNNTTVSSSSNISTGYSRKHS
jgi:hypothetical protein